MVGSLTNVTDKGLRSDVLGTNFYYQWHFTDECNLRCAHCYQESYTSEPLSKESLISTAEILTEALKVWGKVGRISLTGGEPFLYFEHLKYLLSYYDNNPFFNWVGILTNGTLITDDISVKLKQYNKLREVQVSFDGSDKKIHDQIRGVGAYDQAISGVKSLINNGIYTTIMFTLNKSNSHQVIDIIDMAQSLNINAITIERYTPMGNSDKDTLALTSSELESAYQAVEKHKSILKEKGSNLRIRTSRPLWHLINSDLGGFCPVGYSCLSVLADGSVYPCRRLPINLGNVNKEGLFKIWYTSSVLWNLRRKNRMKSECGECQDLSRCGGCRAAAYAAYGDYLAKDPLCWK